VLKVSGSAGADDGDSAFARADSEVRVFAGQASEALVGLTV
jgi:hypothetical protein